MSRYRETRAIIHLDALAENLRSLRKLQGSANSFFCPMVKANGYGHGDVLVSQKLVEEGVQRLGVGLIEEGALLRDAGISCEILFFGVNDQVSSKSVIDYRLTPVLSSWDQLKFIEEVAPRGYSVHLKFDTGMHRLGFELKDCENLYQYFRSGTRLQLTGVLTHLHTGEDASSPEGTSFQQLRLFSEIEKKFSEFNPVSHSLNSAGFLNLAKLKNSKENYGISLNQGVRPGLALYGISPVPNSPVSLSPVMSLRSKTIRYHYVPRGEGVSYNHTWKADKDSVIGVVPIGYADGYHRRLSNQSQVIFRGQKVSVVGNICMDYLMIDITGTLKNETADSLHGEEVILLGKSDNGQEIKATELAEKSQTIVWEILTSVGVRVPREASPQNLKNGVSG